MKRGRLGFSIALTYDWVALPREGSSGPAVQITDDYLHWQGAATPRSRSATWAMTSYSGDRPEELAALEFGSSQTVQLIHAIKERGFAYSLAPALITVPADC